MNRPKGRARKAPRRPPERQPGEGSERPCSFEVTQQWTYMDRSPYGWTHVNNRMIPLVLPDNHLILRDREGTPRFALRYERAFGGGLRVRSIQRERTRYKGAPPNHLWSREKENEAAKRLKEQLGTHPAEALLAEFISRHRDEIAERIGRGKPGLTLSLEGETLGHMSLYKPLIGRFFHRKPAKSERDRQVFHLNPQRKRVREILGI